MGELAYCWTWRKGSSSLVEDIILEASRCACASTATSALRKDCKDFELGILLYVDVITRFTDKRAA